MRLSSLIRCTRASKASHNNNNNDYYADRYTSYHNKIIIGLLISIQPHEILHL